MSLNFFLFVIIPYLCLHQLQLSIIMFSCLFVQLQSSEVLRTLPPEFLFTYPIANKSLPDNLISQVICYSCSRPVHRNSRTEWTHLHPCFNSQEQGNRSEKGVIGHFPQRSQQTMFHWLKMSSEMMRNYMSSCSTTVVCWLQVKG